MLQCCKYKQNSIVEKITESSVLSQSELNIMEQTDADT